MKKYIISLFIVAGLFSSCAVDPDEVFDKTAAQRIEEQVAHVSNVLTSASNGWVMEYYPNEDQLYGGVNILVKFYDDNTVVMTNETASNVNATKASTYIINRSQAAVLSFDTYNEYICYYADPSITEGEGVRYGFEGDLDFAVMSASPTEVVMKGTKTGNTIVMKPVPTNTTWAQYLTTILNVKNEKFGSYVTKFVLNYKDYSVEMADGSDYTLLSYPYVDENGADKTFVAPYMYTDTGIKLYEPMEVYGAKLQNFTWDKNTLRLTCTDAGAEGAYLQGAMEEYFRPYEYYLGEWKFYCTGSGAVSGGHSITITEKEFEKSFTITGITYTSGSNVFNYPITLTWRRDGLVEILGNQIVGKRDVIYQSVPYDNIDIYIRACTSSSTITAAGAGMISSTELHENPNRVDFRNNGVSSTAEGFGYYYHPVHQGSTKNVTAGKFLLPLYMVKQ